MNDLIAELKDLANRLEAEVIRVSTTAQTEPEVPTEVTPEAVVETPVEESTEVPSQEVVEAPVTSEEVSAAPETA